MREYFSTRGDEIENIAINFTLTDKADLAQIYYALLPYYNDVKQTIPNLTDLESALKSLTKTKHRALKNF